DCFGEGINPVNEAAVGATPGAHPKADHVADDGPTHRDTGFVAHVAPLSGSHLALGKAGKFREARLIEDITDRAGPVAFSEELQLRSAQYFDTLNVERKRESAQVSEPERPGDGRIVEIEPDHRCGAVVDATDGEVGERAATEFTICIELQGRRHVSNLI